MSRDVFGDTRVSVPAGLWHRVVLHARQTLARELRWVDDDADAETVLAKFLDSRAGGPARSIPTPAAEPGDLLVKRRAEFWLFTVDGWRELAPVYQMTFEPECGPQGVNAGPDPRAAEAAAELIRGPRTPGVSGVRAARDLGPTASHAESPLRTAKIELGILAGAVRRTIEVAEQPDLGVDDRLRAFAEGLEAARNLLAELER